MSTKREYIAGWIKRAVDDRSQGRCEKCGRNIESIQRWLDIKNFNVLKFPYDCVQGRRDKHAESYIERSLFRSPQRARVVLGRLWGIVLRGRSIGEYDHVDPVAEGNGSVTCAHQLQFICLPCHVKKTGEQAARKRRLPTKRVKKCVM